MKIIALSDTHTNHDKIILLESDILIHAGDYSNSRIYTEYEFYSFINWFEKQPAKHKIFISGNHDFFAFHNLETVINESKKRNIIYLQDNSIVIDGLKIHGSPWVPIFYDWAYMKEDFLLDRFYKEISADTDLLITHGPPFKILDKTFRKEHAGSHMLKHYLRKINPLIHIFGHIHESSGHLERFNTNFYNVSSVPKKLYQEIYI